jgi:hypothetical protein
MGHWYFLTTIPEKYLRVLRNTVNEHPAAVKRDTLDMMAQSCADEIMARWVPIAVPAEEPKHEREPLRFATRYTGLPAVTVH